MIDQLKPYPEYKDSGVEWLGDVPAHWEVAPIKRAFSSMVYGISEPATDDGSVPLLTMGNIRDGVVTVPNHGGVRHVDPAMLLQENDLLFNRTNSAELVGKVGLFKGATVPVTFASYLVRMRPCSDLCPKFLNLLLNDPSVLSRARREAIPSLHQANLNPTRYGRLRIALPPPAEQIAIVRFLDERTEKIDRAADAARREINLLKEFRTRLIADVVTGKLDVREVAAMLPDEPSEDDAEILTEETIEEGEPTIAEEGNETALEEPV